MQIKNLEISNFKSYKHLKLDFRRFNVLIGPNAAGKSNFIRIFKFLRDVVNYGLENAISMQGGAEYLGNISLQDQKLPLELKIDIVPFHGSRQVKKLEDGIIAMKPTGFKNEFSIAFNRDGLEYLVEKDILVQTFDFHKLKRKKSELTDENKIGSGKLVVSNQAGQFNIEFIKDDNVPLSKNEIFPSLFMDFQSYFEEEKPHQTLFIEKQYYMPHPKSIRQALSTLAIYDFDPKLPKQASAVSGMSILEESGENLAIVLRKILKNDDDKRMLFNLVGDVLPFVEGLSVEKFLDKYLQITLHEKYSASHSIPASMMSDGTVFIIAIIIALFFEKNPVAIFEEAGRRIHPQLISKVIDLMKDASYHKQIMLSTHNPEIVKYADLENILFISRDADGFSTINRLNEREEILTFMKNEIGIEELYIQNMLEF